METIADVRLLAIVWKNTGHMLANWANLDSNITNRIDPNLIPRTQEYRGMGCGCGWCN